jgi:hypothetical protein
MNSVLFDILHTCRCSRNEPICGRNSQKEAQSRLEFHFSIYYNQRQVTELVGVRIELVLLSSWIAIVCCPGRLRVKNRKLSNVVDAIVDLVDGTNANAGYVTADPMSSCEWVPAVAGWIVLIFSRGIANGTL